MRGFSVGAGLGPAKVELALRRPAATGEERPRSRTVAATMGSTTAGISDTRDTAIRKGLVWAPEHGRIAFTVPGMAEFIRRQPIE